MSTLASLIVRIGSDAKGLEKDLGKIENKLNRTANKLGRVGKTMTTHVTLPIVAATGAVIKFGADFDSAMTKSLAIMGDVSDAMRGDMEGAARSVAKTTRFSATEAAESYYFLASAGLDAAQSIEALPKVAAFAQAGNFDMARATDLLTDAQSALGLASDDTAENIENMSRVSDTLTKAQTLANASTEEFASSLTSKAGNALNTVNKEVEEGVAALAVFADQGIKGEAAGTLLTNTLFGLSDRARESAADFKRLGIDVFNADGTMRNMADITEDLEDALGGMSEQEKLAELAKMGFTKQAREGILALMGNSDALRNYEKDLKSAGGVTDEVAEKQLDNFWDKLGLIKDQLIDVALELYKNLEPALNNYLIPALQKGVDWLSRIAEWFSGLSVRMRAVIGVIIAVVAAIGPFLLGLSMAYRTASSVIGTLKLLVGTLGGLLTSTTLVVLGIAALVALFIYAWHTSETFREVVTEVFEAIREVVTAVIGVIREVITIALDYIREFWDNWGADIIGFVTNAFEEIWAIIGQVMELIQAVIDVALTWIEWVWDKWGDWIMVAWGFVWDSIVGILTTVWDVIKSTIDGALTIIRGILDVFIGLFTGDWERMWDGMAGILKGVVNVIIGLINGIIGAAERMVNAIGNAINKIPKFKVPNWVPLIGGSEFGLPNIPKVSFPKIPKLATGTNFVPDDMLAWIHKGEAVVPKKYNPDAGGSGGGGGATKKLEISGTIRHEGVNDRGQLVASVDTFMKFLDNGRVQRKLDEVSEKNQRRTLSPQGLGG
ncbi:MAG: phage tail tape measure protein [Firmicutes bacterium]|nr:phage tail tape measure protein [Bacillota bacterium]